ncbi:diguanylate cyclase [Sphingomonas sp. MMS24-J13]|uniref:GGDEF domain-containing protein n=1 Tax=Sphingomonas sp. MMS24-J13 TaxID=3238686 RepID=UPI00384F1EF8
MLIIAGVPLAVGLLFSTAIHIVWRRRREARHARTWSLAFAVIAAGWGLTIMTGWIAGSSPVPGIAASLSWLAAALLFVHGLRQRERRADRGAVLAAIWAAIAVCDGLLIDMNPGRFPLLSGGAPVLTAIGLLLAAIAVGPRLRRSGSLDWIAAALLLSFATGNILLDALMIADGSAFPMILIVPLLSVIIYVGLGLAAMLLLSEDLTIALERVARIDPLTGLWNRRAFNEAAPHMLEQLASSQMPLQASVALSDIDAFKSINDRFGHNVGDEVLAEFARTLKNEMGHNDLLARLGGEEFVLLAIGLDGPALLERVELLRKAIGVRHYADGRLPPITASFGVAEISPYTLGLRDALERADRALYSAKENGRNCSVLDPTPDGDEPNT